MARSKPAPRGWGDVHQRGNGYEVDIRISGRRIRRLLPSKTIAQAVLDELRRAKALGRVGLASWSTSTIAELAPALERRYEAAGLTERTLSSYRQNLTALVKRAGHLEVAKMTPGDVDTLRAGMTKDGLSTSAQRHILDRLSQLLELAVDERVLPAMPFKVKRPKLRAVRPKIATPEDKLATMIGAASRMVNRAPLAAILLAADAGLRRSELLALQGEDVRIDHGWLVVIGKGGKMRTVPILTRRLAAALEKLPLEHGARVLGCETRGQIESLVRDAWRAAYPGTDARFHELRRRFSTVTTGAPDGSLDQTRQWLGHSSAQTTVGYIMERDAVVPPGVREALEGPDPSSRRGRKA